VAAFCALASARAWFIYSVQQPVQPPAPAVEQLPVPDFPSFSVACWRTAQLVLCGDFVGSRKNLGMRYRSDSGATTQIASAGHLSWPNIVSNRSCACAGAAIENGAKVTAISAMILILGVSTFLAEPAMTQIRFDSAIAARQPILIAALMMG
jgi:hypothetical protein